MLRTEPAMLSRPGPEVSSRTFRAAGFHPDATTWLAASSRMQPLCRAVTCAPCTLPIKQPIARL
ncbi:hypothetical protein J3T28_21705 [Salmonella enterica]|uniref:hypothetical protein n=1 Tax=Salmonella enterica TaxID=28901 RepID=UPI0018D1D90D|nr:hypothetical protein [Salmonella enterica]MBH0601284.1 hypothetical protein [Salmonella enterica]MBH0654980.1 hypothetical protein [Salmonella enterica]MBH0667770.1 hypothetical protein [Salmonella enterica]MCU7163111.1 hypothetical protein [Salmonella enterica]